MKKRKPFRERLRCEQYDSPLRWLVDSESDENEVHLVDLQEWSCSCTDWLTRKKQLRDAGAPKKQCTCKHIRKAFEEFSYMMLDTMVDFSLQQEQETKDNAQKSQPTGSLDIQDGQE